MNDDLSILDQWYPPCGPCAFCGHVDKRHRLWDMWIDSPDSDEVIAFVYDTQIEHVKAVRQIRPYRKG